MHLYGEDLLGDDAEHFEVDTVELVETRPGTARREALEELAEGDVVQAVRAVEYHALLSHSLTHTHTDMGHC